MSVGIDMMRWLEPAWDAGDNLLQIVPALMIGNRRRSMRLFAVACAGLVRDRFTDPRSVAAFEFAVRCAEVGVARRRGRPAVAAAAEEAVAEAVARHDYRAGTPESYRCGKEIIARQIAAALVNPDDLHQATQASALVANLRFHDRPWDYPRTPDWSDPATCPTVTTRGEAPETSPFRRLGSSRRWLDPRGVTGRTGHTRGSNATCFRHRW